MNKFDKYFFLVENSPFSIQKWHKHTNSYKFIVFFSFSGNMFRRSLAWGVFSDPLPTHRISSQIWIWNWIIPSTFLKTASHTSLFLSGHFLWLIFFFSALPHSSYLQLWLWQVCSFVFNECLHHWTTKAPTIPTVNFNTCKLHLKPPTTTKDLPWKAVVNHHSSLRLMPRRHPRQQTSTTKDHGNTKACP